MEKNRNITAYHALFQLLGPIVNPLISLLGMMKGIRADGNNSISFIYFHSIKRKQIIPFERLIISLKEKYKFIDLFDAVTLLNKNQVLEYKYLSLSFDDGFRDNLEAARILHSHSIPATFFIVTEWINGNLHLLDPVFEKYSHNEQPLTWDDVRSISRMGFSIGSHSASHCRFSDVSESKSFAELIKSKQEIEDKIGVAVHAFSFPFGRITDYKQSDVDLVFKAGYRNYVITELHQYTQKIDMHDGICRFGMEPFVNRRSFEYLLHGLLQDYR